MRRMLKYIAAIGALALLLMGGVAEIPKANAYVASKAHPGPGRIGVDFILGHRGQVIPMIAGGGPELTMTVKQLNEEISGKSKILHEIFEEAGPTIDLSLVKTGLGEGDTNARAEKLKSMNDELSNLGELREKRGFLESGKAAAARMHEEQNKPSAKAPHPAGAPEPIKTYGQLRKETNA